MTSAQAIPTDWKRPFFAVWSGQAVSLVGSALVQFALIWWITQKTESGMVLAVASLIGSVPGILLGPFSGVLVDRWNRRRIMIGIDALVALASFGLAILFWLDIIQIWHIYLAIFVRSLSTIQGLAMRASTTLMVPESHLSRVAGYNQTLNNVIRIGLPPLGAVLIGVLSIHLILLIDVTTALFGILPLFFVAIPQPVRSTDVDSMQRPSLWSDLAAGIRYVLNWRGLLYVILMMSILNFLLDPAFALVPILVVKHFAGGPFHLATLESAFSLGGLLSGIIISVWAIRRKVQVAFLGVAGVGLGCLALGLAPAWAFWLGLVGMVTIAVMMGISDAPFGALLQARVAPEMQGRVFAVMGSLMSILSPIGLLIAGWLADTVGVQWWFNLGGILCFIVGFGALRIPAIMQLEGQPDPPR